MHWSDQTHARERTEEARESGLAPPAGEDGKLPRMESRLGARPGALLRPTTVCYRPSARSAPRTTMGVVKSGDERVLVRAPHPRVMTGPGGVWLLGGEADGAVRLEGDSAALVLAVLESAGTPRPVGVLVEQVLAQAGGDASARGPIDEAIALLARLGALVAPGENVTPAPRVVGNVLLAVTGAIGAADVPRLVQGLVAVGHDVRVVMTRSARRFVAPRALEALTHRPVARGMWGGTPTEPAPHVALARWADVVVVCPCTATTLGRIAAGDCSELVSAVATTTRAPVLLVPSMNEAMLSAPRVEANLEALTQAGFFVAHPGQGHEVADAPGERALRPGAATAVANVTRWVEVLLEHARRDAPRLASAAEWDAEHEELPAPAVDAPLDPALSRALDACAPRAARVLDVGTGAGEIARAAARRGHAVVATDVSSVAIGRAQAVAPEIDVTWLVDDATASSLHARFDVCIDRACLGCVGLARRERYLAQVAAWLRPGGAWILQVHQAPAGTLRSYAFTADELRTMTAEHFEVVSIEASTLSFGAWSGRPAWTCVLKRRSR